MATLTLIGEPFPDGEAAAHAEAARELTQAIADTAPRGCSARLLIAAEREAPVFATARARVEKLPLRSAVLPLLWRSGFTARPLDGEFVHALTPLVPLRTRSEYDGSQTSVTVPHALAWQAPELMGASAARQYRAFVKRAARHADVVITPTHATAAALQEYFRGGVTVQVLPMAPPVGYLRPDDAEARRDALGLPPRYLATTAVPGEIGRLDWLFAALEQDEELPPLVVIAGSAPLDGATGAAEAAGAADAADAAGAGDAGDGADDGGESDGPGVEGQASSAGAKAADARAEGVATAAARPAAETEPLAVPEQLRGRVRVVRPRELADIGAVLSGAELLAMPQAMIGTGYEILGALAAGVPVVHADCAAAAELAFDAAVAAETPGEFARELRRLASDGEERARLGVLAEDRSRAFTWAGTARLLWELHANI